MTSRLIAFYMMAFMSTILGIFEIPADVFGMKLGDKSSERENVKLFELILNLYTLSLSSRTFCRFWKIIGCKVAFTSIKNIFSFNLLCLFYLFCGPESSVGVGIVRRSISSSFSNICNLFWPLKAIFGWYLV